MTVSALENLYQTLCNLFFYKEKTIKMSFTNAYASQNVIRKNLFQIFRNLLNLRKFVLAKVCAVKAQVDLEPTQTSKMELFARLVGRLLLFVILA